MFLLFSRVSLRGQFWIFPVPYIALPCLRWLVISKANNATGKLFVLLAVVVGDTCWESVKMHEKHANLQSGS